MPKIIVTSRYLKSGASKNLKNYVKYIATRPNAVAVNDQSAPATQNQQALIASLVKDFPDSVTSTEYLQYAADKTHQNASALIDSVMEENVDRVVMREKYIEYLAHRPGAVKVSGHALFGQTDDPIDLNAAANEIANHRGNVWTHVVSLRRADAQQMGYDTLDAWRDLVRRQMPNIAKQMKIDLNNLRWYAVFHDKETNPHVHIVVYSADPREGFLTEYGIEKIRSGFANDVYADELHHLYEQQTDVRDLLKKNTAGQMRELTARIAASDYGKDELSTLLMKLKTQLANTKGKKVFGYLPKDVKQTVDVIFAMLAAHPDIKKMYALWCEMEQRKHDVYSSAKVDFPPLTENPQFKSVKNMIVKAALDMPTQIHFDPEQLQPEDFVWDETSDTVCEDVPENTFPPPPVQEQDSEIAATIFGLFVSISQVIENDYLHQERQFWSRVDRKLRGMIQRQKEAIGLKSDGQQYQ